MKNVILVSVLCGALILCLSSPATAMDGQELKGLYEHLFYSKLDTLSTIRVSDLDIESRDMKLNLKSGRLAFFKPANIDGAERYYAAYFVGEGNFTFLPSSEESILRINHKVGKDSVLVELERALLVFSDQIYRKIVAKAQPCDDKFGKTEIRHTKGSWKRLTNKEKEYFIFELMRHMTEKVEEPFLMVNPQKGNWSKSYYYCYDPLFVEDIRLMKNEIVGPNFAQEMRTVCAYTCPAGKHRDGCFRLTDPQITPRYYDVKAELDSSLYMNVEAEIGFTINDTPAQLLWFALHENMKIDHIVDGEGKAIGYLRYTEESNRSDNLYLALNRVYQPGEELILKFKYNGRVIDFDKSTQEDLAINTGIWNISGDTWCPHYYEPQKSDLKVEFQYPAMFDKLKITSVGKETVHEIKDGMVVSAWQSTEPGYFITFDAK